SSRRTPRSETRTSSALPSSTSHREAPSSMSVVARSRTASISPLAARITRVAASATCTTALQHLYRTIRRMPTSFGGEVAGRDDVGRAGSAASAAGACFDRIGKTGVRALLPAALLARPLAQRPRPDAPILLELLDV